MKILNKLIEGYEFEQPTIFTGTIDEFINWFKDRWEAKETGKPFENKYLAGVIAKDTTSHNKYKIGVTPHNDIVLTNVRDGEEWIMGTMKGDVLKNKTFNF